MIALKSYAIIFILILSYSSGQQSQCDNGYCDDQIRCDLGLCCNNTCVDITSPAIKTGNKGDSCSTCKGCKGTLCCEKGICSDACGTSKGEFKCGCTNSTECNAFWLTGVKYICVQGQCLPEAAHMDECIDDLQCDSLLGLKKCLDDPKTNKKRCMVGAKLGEACSNTTYREDMCDPTADGVWSNCVGGECVTLPQEGERCNVSLFKNFPCATPWLTCVSGVCAPHFSVPLNGDCNGPTQCQIPLVCNSTERNWQVEWQYSPGKCVLPTFDVPCKQTGTQCTPQLQKCGCKDESPVCLSKPISNQCNSAYKALELCASANSHCLPPFYSAFGWLSRRGPDSCLQEFCKEQLLEFYCCYSCDNLILKGLKCYETPRAFEEASCCAGDVECYVAKAQEYELQKQYCSNSSEVVVIIPPLSVTPQGASSPGSDQPAGVDYNAIITTVGLFIGLALGALFFGIYYWRKKAEYEQIRSWNDDSHNPQATQMQQVGISVGN